MAVNGHKSHQLHICKWCPRRCCLCRCSWWCYIKFQFRVHLSWLWAAGTEVTMSVSELSQGHAAGRKVYPSTVRNLAGHQRSLVYASAPPPNPFHRQVNMQKTNKSNNCSTQTHANAPPEMHTLAQAHAHSHAHPGKCIKIKQTALVTGNKKDSSNNSNNGSPAAITTATAHKRFLTRALEKGYLFQWRNQVFWWYQNYQVITW